MTKELQSVRSKIIKAVFKEDFQILGRKIGLEDVLRAMKKKKNRVFTDQIHLIAGALKILNGNSAKVWQNRANQHYIFLIRF